MFFPWPIDVLGRGGLCWLALLALDGNAFGGSKPFVGILEAQVLVLLLIIFFCFCLFGSGSLFAYAETGKACSEHGGRFCSRRLEDAAAWTRVG